MLGTMEHELDICILKKQLRLNTKGQMIIQIWSYY